MARARDLRGRRRGMGRIGSPAQLLDSRLALRVEPGRISPASRVINGTARYTDPLRSGTPRQLQPKYGLTTNGVGEFAELAYVRAAHTAATVCFHVNDLGSAAADRWVAVGGTAGGIDVVWTSDGFDVIVASDASNYTTYAYNGGALSGFKHVGVTVSGTTVVAYLDGSPVTLVPAATGTGFDGTIPATERVRIGADAADTAANHSNATFDDFRYFGTALPAASMMSIGAMGPGSTSGFDVGTQPIHWVDFELGGTGTTEPNKGTNGTGFTLTGTVANMRGQVGVYSFANEIGFTEGTGSNGAAVGERISANPADLTKDIAGNLLQYTGQAPRDMVLSSPCVTLNGTNEYISIPVTIGGTSWEVSCWIKTTDTNAIIVDSTDGDNDGWLVRLVSGQLRISSDAADLDTGFTYNDGVWHYVRFIWDGATSYIYVDDNLITSAAMSAPASVAATTSRVGLSVSDTAGYLGDLSNLVISNSGTTVGNWPMTEGGGDTVYDTSGNGNHGTITGTLANVWANQQNISDTLVKDGYSVGTWCDGSNDGLVSASSVVSGWSRFCLSCWLNLDTLSSNHYIASEYDATGNQRSWYVIVNTSGQVVVVVSSTGLATTAVTSVDALTAGSVHNVQVIIGGGTVAIEIDGVASSVTGTTDATALASTSQLAVGQSITGGTRLTGTVSQLLIHKDPTVVWGTATKAAIRAAGTTAEIKSIVNDLGGTAWYFPDAKTETLQSLPALTVNGAPEQRVIPVGTGLPPVGFGPGLLAPVQSLDLYCGEDDAPICQLLAADLSDGDYDFADGDEGDALFKQGDANGEQIAVINPAATGAELTVLNAWSN